MEFRRWLQNHEQSLLEHEGTSGKTGLYPKGAMGIGLYPPQTYTTRSADAIYYISIDERLFKGKEGSPFSIKHIPGKPSHTELTFKNGMGEKSPWDISHLPGPPKPLKPNDYILPDGDGEPWAINHLPGGPNKKPWIDNPLPGSPKNEKPWVDNKLPGPKPTKTPLWDIIPPE